jgi:hypothetical protein
MFSLPDTDSVVANTALKRCLTPQESEGNVQTTYRYRRGEKFVLTAPRSITHAGQRSLQKVWQPNNQHTFYGLLTL